MACAPCAKMRANLRTALRAGDIVGGAKIAVAGVAAMTHLKDKSTALAETEQVVRKLDAVEAPNVRRYGG